MSGVHNSHHAAVEIRNPGPLRVTSGLTGFLVACAVIGLVSFLVGLKSGYEKNAWSSFVINHFYFLSLALGGLFFAAIQWATSAMWSATVRRLAEAFTAYLPIALVTFLILAFGIHHIYEWSHSTVVQSDPILLGKSGYLNTGFFVVRNLVALGIWLFFAKKLIGNSLAQDLSKDAALTARNKSWAPAFLILFAITFTMASFDQIMSLDPHWFSTIFGVYCFAGLFYSTLAALCIFTIVLKRKGYLQGLVSEHHMHDIGKFMFAFTVFWAYIGFSQFMLIWYANLPEETGYFIRRMDTGWMPVSIFLLVGKFFTPFFLLLPRDSKRNEKLLLAVAVFMLVAQWIDLMWLVQPQFFADRPHLTWVELGVTLGFIGMFGLAVTRFLSRNSVVAIGDPRLSESVHHHQ